MDQNKISPDLYMAVNVSETLREKSLELNVGYDEYFNEWELIIRYTGNVDNIREDLGISIEELIGGYAIVRIPQFLIGRLSEYPQIDYIEKPKSLLLSEMNGVNASCVARVRLPGYELTGRGCLTAILDSGVDIYHPDFQNDDGTTRIERLWDQTVPGNPPAGFRTGSLYTNEEINIAIRSENGNFAEGDLENAVIGGNFDDAGIEVDSRKAVTEGDYGGAGIEGNSRNTVTEGDFDGAGISDDLKHIGIDYGESNDGSKINRRVLRGRDIVPEFDTTGHGTAVLGIMAGNGRASDGRNRGMAPEAGIVAVKLGNTDGRGFPRTTQLMLAVDYVVRYAVSVRKPIAINISFGNNYGAHNGGSILERYLDTVANMYQIAIVAGVGNEGVTARHASGRLENNRLAEIEIIAGEYLRTFNLQIWKNYQDDFDVFIETPFGRTVGPVTDLSEVASFASSGNVITAYYGMPTPYNPRQEVYVSFSAQNEYITPGIWKIYLQSRRLVSGEYDMWLPVAGSTSAEVSFARPDIFNTLTIPSTARSVISAAAYDSRNDSYAPFSGRGRDYESDTAPGYAKPDIAAPGVAINSTRAGGGYGEFSGTSFAAPFVTGAAALLMQYGIVDDNDPYLYGEKLRASLIRGARPLPVQESFPSPLLGWGALCVADSVV